MSTCHQDELKRVSFYSIQTDFNNVRLRFFRILLVQNKLKMYINISTKMFYNTHN